MLNVPESTNMYQQLPKTLPQVFGAADLMVHFLNSGLFHISVIGMRSPHKLLEKFVHSICHPKYGILFTLVHTVSSEY